jgi:serine/threonine protein kinase
MVLGPGKLVANKYRLERPLAAGGMGAVWIARHLELDVEIALKFILEQPSEEAETSRARFKREAQAAARLKSPHVAQIHDYGVEGTMPYIAMELLEGEDLATLLARSGRLPLARTLAIAQQLCRGLQVAHDAGIVHRDLKPSNVFLARMGDEHLVKILDFGIAKVIGVSLPKSARTASGAIIGSPRYMSPEQLLGIKVGPPADLWAVGMLLFEMLTAACPFENELMFDVADAVGGGPHPAASEIVPGLPAGIDAFFERALALDPKQRFASARQLAEALERVAAGELAPRPHRRTLRPWPQRRAPTAARPRPSLRPIWRTRPRRR